MNVRAMSIKMCASKGSLRVLTWLLGVNEKLKDVRVQGWVRRVERRGSFIFCHVGDGFSLNTLQAIIPRDICGRIGIGSAIDVTGDWVNSKGRRQNMELLVNRCNIVGLQRNLFNQLPNEESSAEFTRKNYHLRLKSIPFTCLLRLRSRLDQLSRCFFQEESFIHVDTPLLTHNDCEGAGDVFTIQTDQRNYFGEEAVYLPVSCQLHLEAFVGSLPKVYTIAPALRADHSQTRQHLAEFRMLEAEYAFADDLEQLCDLVERYINYVVDGMVLGCTTEEVASVMQVFCDEKAKVQSLFWKNGARRPFPRMYYDEAVTMLQSKGERIPAGQLSKENELSLVEYCAGPLFVLRYPYAQKPFYMKRFGDQAECFDLLAPFVGELAGGSLRESDPEELRRRGCDESLEWYLEIRQHGHPPSAGFEIRCYSALTAVNEIGLEEQIDL